MGGYVLAGRVEVLLVETGEYVGGVVVLDVLVVGAVEEK